MNFWVKLGVFLSTSVNCPMKPSTSTSRIQRTGGKFQLKKREKENLPGLARVVRFWLLFFVLSGFSVV